MYLQPHPSVVELAANCMGWDPWIGEAGGKSGVDIGGFGLLPSSGALKGARIEQIFLLCLGRQTEPGRLRLC